MPVKRVVDKSGRGIYLVPFRDIYISPQFNEPAVHMMEDFPLREDDVILVSYPKTGCHWVWEIIRILVTGKIVNDGKDKCSLMMEWNPQEDFASLPSPRLLNNHIPFAMQPRDLLIKKPKVVFLYRNFKDVAVSFFHHHSGIPAYEYNGDNFQAYVERVVDGLVESGNPFTFTRDWERGMERNSDLPVFCCAYEDMKKAPKDQMRRLCSFLGQDRSDEFLQKVCDATSFQTMKQTQGVDMPVFYRKGQVGDWQNYFTPDLNEWFDELIKKEMAGTKLNFQYN